MLKFIIYTNLSTITTLLIYYHRCYSSTPFVWDIIIVDPHIKILPIMRHYFKFIRKATEASKKFGKQMKINEYQTVLVKTSLNFLRV